MEYKIMSESELNDAFGTAERLRSGGDYGCACIVFEGDIEWDGDAFSYGGFRELRSEVEGSDRIKEWDYPYLGTYLFSGNLTLKGDVHVTNDLMCLVVMGDLSADILRIEETEVLVVGDAKVVLLCASEDYYSACGTEQYGQRFQSPYED